MMKAVRRARRGANAAGAIKWGARRCQAAWTAQELHPGARTGVSQRVAAPKASLGRPAGPANQHKARTSVWPEVLSIEGGQRVELRIVQLHNVKDEQV